LDHRQRRPSGSGCGLHLGVERGCRHQEVDAYQTSPSSQLEHGSQFELGSQLELIRWNQQIDDREENDQEKDDVHTLVVSFRR